MNDGMDEMKGDIPFVKPFVKPCPFCGQEAVVINSLPVPGNYAVCLNVDCNCFNRAYSIRYWNDRPIEDALLARAEKAEAMVERLIEVGFDFFHGNPYTIHEKHYDELVAEWERRNDKQEAE